MKMSKLNKETIKHGVYSGFFMLLVWLYSIIWGTRTLIYGSLFLGFYFSVFLWDYSLDQP